MPKIRLNKAVKEFNISMSRLVEFLQSKGIEVESNPNAQLEEAAYSALEAEFAKDGEQRKASHEVVITKVPEEKLEIEEKKTPEVIRAKANKPETKILGKIEIAPKKGKAGKTEEKEKPQEKKPAKKAGFLSSLKSIIEINTLNQLAASIIQGETSPYRAFGQLVSAWKYRIASTWNSCSCWRFLWRSRRP